MLERELKKIRKKKNLSLEELSLACKLPLAYLQEVEEGKRKLTSKALDKLLSCQELSEELADFNLSSKGLGDKIRALREEKQMTLDELGIVLGLSITYLSEIELGERNPSVQTLQKISHFFNLPVSLFLGTPKLVSIGKKIRKTREAKGLNQKQLAKSANVTPSLIAQLEAGKVQPSLKTVEKISAVLGVSTCYLIMEQEDVESIIGSISPNLRELLFNPDVQTLIAYFSSLDREQTRLVFNFIHMLKNPAL